MAKKTKELSLEEKLEQALVPVEEQPYEVPGNWCWCHISDIADVVTGSTPSKKKEEYYGGEFPFFKPADLDAGDKVYEATEYLSDEGKAVSRIIPELSTAVCCIGSIGKSGLLLREGTTNQQINSIITKLNAYYMYYYTKTEYFVSQLWSKSTSTTISMVNKSNMKTVYFPLAPEEEQKRIVEAIESLFAKLDEAKEIAEEIVFNSDERKKAIYKKAFDGSLTNRWREENRIDISSWERIPFEKLGKLERGRSKHRPRNDERLFGGVYPFIQTGDVAGAGMYVTSHKQTLSEFGFEQSRMFPKGTLCITIAANIGDAAILSYDCCFPDSVVGFTPGEKCLNKYMYFYLQEIKAELEYIAPATAQKNLNLKLLGAVEIKVPSLKEQEKIVEVLEKQINYQDSIVEKAEGVIDSIDIMKKSILAKAFRGELGTNIESEESSIELLKQILEVS